MDIDYANSHPLKVIPVQDEGFYANSHPYKVVIVGGGGGTGGEARVVDSLPAEGEVGYIYLVLKEQTSSGDIYDEFIWALQQDGETYDWEHLGTTNAVNLGLNSDLTVSNSVGLYNVGDIIPEGTPFETIIRGMLSKIYYPTFVSPSFSVTYSQALPSYRKVGSTIPAGVVTSTFSKGAIMLNGVKQGDAVGEPTEYYLFTSGADTNVELTNASGSFNVSELTRSTKGKLYLSVRVSYPSGPQPKDSEGKDYGEPYGAGRITAGGASIDFIVPFYWGVSNTTSVSDFTGLTESVTPKAQKMFTYSTDNQYMVIAYDSSYGDLKSILDPNSFETIDGWDKSVLTVDGWEYNVYVAKTPTTDASAQYTFKF